MGVELTPDKWTFRAMAGRLRYQSLFDIGARSGLDERYRRQGLASEVGYRGKGFGASLTVFAAEDRLPDESARAEAQEAPASNVVASLKGDVQLWKGATLEGEYARSYLTADLNAPLLADSIATESRPLEDRLSTNSADVIRVGFRQNIFRVGYERIAPGYKSLGTLFLQNDRDNLTAGATFPIKLGNKEASEQTPWTVAVDGGLERNGISENSLDRGRRIIGRAMANGQIGKRLAVNAQFSNFSSTSRLRGFLDPTTSTDSVFIAQVNRQASIGASLMPKEGVGGVLTGQLSFTDVSTLQDGRLSGFGSTVTNVFTSYARQYAEAGFGWSVQGLYARTNAGPASQTLYGPSASVSQQLAKGKLRVEASGTMSFISLDDGGDNRVLTVRPTATYNLDRFGNVTLAYTHTGRSLARAQNFSENLLSLQYGWTF